MLVVTGLLGVGVTELLVVLLLFLALFGVERIPQVARTLGRLQGEWSKARRGLEREMRTEEERAADARRAFEAQRERHVRRTLPETQEYERLRNAAEALGVPTEGRSAEELRAAVREAAGTGHPGDGQDAPSRR